jgi:O-antigen ligase
MITIILAFNLVKSRRKLVIAFVIIGALVGPVYLAATWNSSSIVAQPTRAIRSAIDPSARDDSSDTYRDIENTNLIYNIQIDPVQGRGYGKEINFYIPLPPISQDFYWWDIIPHNTVLWVWMRLGFIGFAAFWLLVGHSIATTIMTTRRLKDPYLQSVGVFAVVGLVTWVFMGFLDMGLVDFRETTLMGALIGIVSLLLKMDKKEEEEPVAEKIKAPLSDFGTIRTGNAV